MFLPIQSPPLDRSSAGVTGRQGPVRGSDSGNEPGVAPSALPHCVSGSIPPPGPPGTYRTWCFGAGSPPSSPICTYYDPFLCSSNPSGADNAWILRNR
jgi:hypothetical protein